MTVKIFFTADHFGTEKLFNSADFHKGLHPLREIFLYPVQLFVFSKNAGDIVCYKSAVNVLVYSKNGSKTAGTDTTASLK